MKQPARRAATLLLLFVALASLHGCGSDDKTLGASETIQAVFRIRWTAAMLDQATTLTQPLFDLEAPFADNTLDDARAKLRADYGDCVVIEPELGADPATELQVTLLAAGTDACAEPAPPCSGSYTLQLDQDEPTGLRLEAGEGLHCLGDVVTGTITIRPLSTNDANPFPHLLELDGLRYSDSREINGTWVDYDAAEDFTGQFFVRADVVTTLPHPEATTEVDVPVHLYAGTGGFHDVELGYGFVVEARDLGVQHGTSTPRTGEARLETDPTSHHTFETRWVALTQTATTVRIERGNERWTGCISYGDPDECHALGY